MRIKGAYVRRFSLFAAALLALPLSWGALTGLCLWTSPYLLLVRLLAGHAFVLLNLLAVAALGMSLAGHRWYCRWVCPTGELCDSVSRLRGNSSSLGCIPELGGILAGAGLLLAVLGTPLLGVLDPVNIFYAAFGLSRGQAAPAVAIRIAALLLVLVLNLAVPHIWCRKLCPLGGLQDFLSSVKHLFTKKERAGYRFSPARRVALGALAGAGAGLLLRNRPASAAPAAIYPPGALPGDEFKTTCLRCGSCARSCPTDIIRNSFDPGDILGLLTPRVGFENGYCLPECTACGRVCPSGAIARFAAGDKKKLKMGIARIELENCRLTKYKECDLCFKYCAYDAVVIRSSSGSIAAWPEIIDDKCVGCGACQVICPETVITVLPVSGRG